MLLNCSVGEDAWESLDCKEIQPVHPKGNQCWTFIGKTDAEAETPILWPADRKNWLMWKVPDTGKDWRQVEKGTTEDEMVRWHHLLNGHEFGWTLGVWWWIGRPGMLWFMGSQRVGRNWVTALNRKISNDHVRRSSSTLAYYPFWDTVFKYFLRE